MSPPTLKHKKRDIEDHNSVNSLEPLTIDKPSRDLDLASTSTDNYQNIGGKKSSYDHSPSIKTKKSSKKNMYYPIIRKQVHSKFLEIVKEQAMTFLSKDNAGHSTKVTENELLTFMV
jgi:hypothetical protein